MDSGAVVWGMKRRIEQVVVENEKQNLNRIEFKRRRAREAIRTKTSQRRLQRNETCINFYWKSILNNIEKAEMENHPKFFLCTVITDAHQYTQFIYPVNEQWHFTIKFRHEQEMPVWCLFSLFPSFSYSYFFFLQILISDSSTLHTHLFYILFK